MIQFEDGSILEPEDWDRIMDILRRRVQEGKQPAPTKIQSGSVTVKLDKLQPKKRNGKADSPDYTKYTEAKYRGWTIRVWKQPNSFGCNYFRGQRVRYIEVDFAQAIDEREVFKYAERVIDDLDES